MKINEQFAQLATRAESTGPFLSLYIDTKGGDGTRKDRVRLLLKQELQRLREALDLPNGNQRSHEETIEQGVRQIESYVADSLSPDVNGLAIFSSPQEQFFLPVELPVQVRPELFIGSRPHLRQLALLQSRHPHIIAALVDAKNGRLCDIRLGHVTDESSIMDPDVPRKVDQGGWSQANIQRHIQDHIDHHQKDVAEQLTRMVDQRHPEAVVLIGQERNLANFEGFLSKRVLDAVAGSIHLDIRSPHEEIVRAAEELVEETRRSAMVVRLEELASIAQKNGRATLGWNGVARAVNERKLEHLLLRHDVQSRGWKCTNCAVIGLSVPLGCPSCGGSVLTVDLVEQFLSAALSEDAKLSFAPAETVLDEYDGVGAFLRF
jgi:hypothetical protein